MRFGDSSIQTIDRATDSYKRIRLSLTSQTPWRSAEARPNVEIQRETNDPTARASGAQGGQTIHVSIERFFTQSDEDREPLMDLIHEAAHNAPAGLDDAGGYYERGINPERLAEFAVDG
jgi:hypothetical protein